MPTQQRSPLRHYALAALLVVVTLATSVVLRRFLKLPDLEMLFLLSVMVAAFWLGRGPSLLAAALGVACYDFFLVPPLHTFTVGDRRYFLTFAMMFVVGFVMSELAARARRAKDSAMRAKTEEMRSSLLSAVSHDLRTPLASITGAATSLRDDTNLDPDTRGELIVSIVDEAERLERLVANLLDMTRLESGGVSLRRDWLPLDEIIGSALTRLETRLETRKVTVDIAPDVPLVLVDPVLFEQVFVNLIENAIKYTPHGTPLIVEARRAGEQVDIVFVDKGPGLPPGSEFQVFEKFYRGPHAGLKGAGLGLPICKGIVEAHGGTIRAETRSSGGAAFYICIPCGGTPPSLPAAEVNA